MIEIAERHREPKQSLLTDRQAAVHIEPALEADLSLWKAIAGLVATLAILITALITICFVVAKLVTGYAV
jgi:hypothetical protein